MNACLLLYGTAAWLGFLMSSCATSAAPLKMLANMSTETLQAQGKQWASKDESSYFRLAEANTAVQYRSPIRVSGSETPDEDARRIRIYAGAAYTHYREMEPRRRAHEERIQLDLEGALFPWDGGVDAPTNTERQTDEGVFRSNRNGFGDRHERGGQPQAGHTVNDNADARTTSQMLDAEEPELIDPPVWFFESRKDDRQTADLSETAPAPRNPPKDDPGHQAQTGGEAPVMEMPSGLEDSESQAVLINPYSAASLNAIWEVYRRFDFEQAVRMGKELGAANGVSRNTRAVAWTLVGASYYLMGHERPCKSAIRQAVQLDRTLSPDPSIFPSVFCTIFHQVGEEVTGQD